MHDPRVGRFFAVDPLAKKHPHYTPYVFAGNKPISHIDELGLSERYAAVAKEFRTSLEAKGISSDNITQVTTDNKIILSVNLKIGGKTETIKYEFSKEQDKWGEVNFLTNNGVDFFDANIAAEEDWSDRMYLRMRKMDKNFPLEGEKNVGNGIKLLVAIPATVFTFGAATKIYAVAGVGGFATINGVSTLVGGLTTLDNATVMFYGKNRTFLSETLNIKPKDIDNVKFIAGLSSYAYSLRSLIKEAITNPNLSIEAIEEAETIYNTITTTISVFEQAESNSKTKD